MSSRVVRPVLRYHGGKWRLAPPLLAYFPRHRVYVEPFGGGASVLLRKARSTAEIYNDVDLEIVNVFRQLRDHGGELQRRLRLTPFARCEFEQAYEAAADPIEQARRTIIKSFMGFGSGAIWRQSGFRAAASRSGRTAAPGWRTYADSLDALIERLRGVVIECRDYQLVITAHDSPQTLFYVDPPYVYSTRTSAKAYAYELTDRQHAALAQTLHRVQGKVVLSGYASRLYADLYHGWRRAVIPALADGGRPRTEVLWMNFDDNQLFADTVC